MIRRSVSMVGYCCLGVVAVGAFLVVRWAWAARVADVANVAEVTPPAAGDAPVAVLETPLRRPAPEFALEPVAASETPLPPPPAAADPLSGTSAPLVVKAHDELALLPAELTADKAPSYFSARWAAIANSSPGDARYRSDGDALEAMLRQAFTRWPELGSSVELRRILFNAAERAHPPAELGDDLWPYAVAQAQAAQTQGQKLTATDAALHEVRRALSDRQPGLAAVYAMVVRSHAPEPSAQLALLQGRIDERLERFEQAHESFRAATAASEPRTALDAWKEMLALAMRMREDQHTCEAAAAVLAHSLASDEDRAWALYGRAQARFALGDAIGGMDDCRTADRQYPGTTYAVHARRLAKEARTDVLRAVAAP